MKSKKFNVENVRKFKIYGDCVGGYMNSKLQQKQNVKGVDEKYSVSSEYLSSLYWCKSYF